MSETVADVGEFGLIHRIHEVIQREGIHNPGVTLGIGDDCASFKPRQGFEQLITCDCAVEGRHFLPDHTTPLDLGRRTMVMNISDIGAMGGHPLYALVSLGLKEDTPVSDVEEMYRGFTMELNPFEACIIGGNLTKIKDAIFIDITLIGEVERENLIRRSTAQTEDTILVTGYPGQAAAGLKLLMSSPLTENLKAHPLIKAYNTPTHRAKEGRMIAQSGFATAMIDTSDGFLADLGHICQESRAGAVLAQEKLPISDELRQTADRLKLDPYSLFLQESDDYELIVTCSPDDVNSIRSVVSKVGNVPVTEVGRITTAAEDIQMIFPDGTQSRIIPVGWDHFKT